MARVSIVIATYNRAAYLGQAIRSTLDQAVSNLELIVIDDGSTDDTREIVHSFASDPRLTYVFQENQGATAAFNRGIRECTGDYLGILGSDDWYLVDGLLPLVDELDQQPQLGVVAGGYLFVDKTGRPLRRATPWQDYPRLDVTTWLFSCPVLFQASLIRKTWVDKMGGVATGLQDWDLGLRLAHAGCAMGWVEATVFAYRMHESQSVRDAGMVRREALAVMDNFFALSDLPRSVLARKKAAYANAYLKSVVSLYEVGHPEQAQQDLDRACRLNPGLVEDRGQALWDLFVARASLPLTREPYAFLETVFMHLPRATGELRTRYREAIAAVAVSMCFTAHRERDWPLARRTWLRAVANHPTLLRNRGMISIAVRAFGLQCGQLMRRTRGQGTLPVSGS